MARERNTCMVKNLYAANQKGIIIYKSKHRQTDRQAVGIKHDYKVYKDNHPELPKDIERMYE
jgi:hypothetical protein